VNAVHPGSSPGGPQITEHRQNPGLITPVRKARVLLGAGLSHFLGEQMALYGEAKRAYQRQWMKKRRQAWIDSKGGCCARCGATDSLEVDHIDPAKKTMEPSYIWSRTAAAVAEELSNCQVLCSRCHLNKTFGTTGIRHGTTNGYKHYKCRCQLCRDANAASVQRQRAAKAVRHALAA
jgi:5-methylcytosine-specific restriction endonuclease McrA